MTIAQWFVLEFHAKMFRYQRVKQFRNDKINDII